MSATRAAEESRQLRAAATLTGAVIVTGPRHLDVAGTLAEQLAAAVPEDETTVAVPDGARWKVDELADQVLAPARYGTLTHRHLIVADAHRATGTAHDKLLKTLEEPASDTTFWLCHPQTAALPATLQGRAVRTVHLAGPDPEDVRADLVALGADPATADRVLALAAGDPALARVAVRFDMVAVLETFRSSPTTLTPHEQAARVCLAAAHLAVALGHKTSRAPASPRNTKASQPVADLARLTPPQRAQLRRLVDRLLDDWEDAVLAQVSDVSTAAAMSTLEARLSALGRARDAAVYNTSVPTILTATLSALNS